MAMDSKAPGYGQQRVRRELCSGHGEKPMNIQCAGLTPFRDPHRTPSVSPLNSRTARPTYCCTFLGAISILVQEDGFSAIPPKRTGGLTCMLSQQTVARTLLTRLATTSCAIVRR